MKPRRRSLKEARAYLQALIDTRLGIAEIEGGMSERYETAFVNIRFLMNKNILEAATEVNQIADRN
jgi:hypothetical protein